MASRMCSYMFLALALLGAADAIVGHGSRRALRSVAVNLTAEKGPKAAVNVTTDKSSAKQRAAANLSVEAKFPTLPEVANPGCFNHTGRRCDSQNPCKPWTTCVKDRWSADEGWCVCPSWGCADSLGTCRPIHNRWLDMELKIARSAAPNKDFLMMATDEGSPPIVTHTWPDQSNPEGIWDLLIEPDNITVLFATKKSRDTYHGHFLDVDDFGGNTTDAGYTQPLQRKPRSALQAAWNLVLMDRGRMALRHIRSARYLFYDQRAERFSTCTSPDCPEESADFDIWPRIDSDQVPCETCETPYRLAGSGWGRVKTHVPWFLKPVRPADNATNSQPPWYLEKK